MSFDDEMRELTHALESRQFIQVDEITAAQYSERAYLYRLQDQYDLSEQDLSKAIELVPDNANYHFNRGFSAHMQGKDDAAIADFTRAIELADDNKDLKIRILKLRKAAYHRTKESALALADANRILELSPDDISVLRWRGYYYLHRAKLDEVWSDIQRMLSIDANDTPVLLLKVQYWLRVQEYAKAEALMHMLLEKHRDNQAFVQYQKQFWIEARQKQEKDTTPDW